LGLRGIINYSPRIKDFQFNQEDGLEVSFGEILIIDYFTYLWAPKPKRGLLGQSLQI